MEYDFNPEHESDLELVHPKDAEEMRQILARRGLSKEKPKTAPEPAQTK